MWWWAFICTGHAVTVSTGQNIVPIKYGTDYHTPEHNYDVINIVNVIVWGCNFYLVTVFVDSGYSPKNAFHSILRMISSILNKNHLFPITFDFVKSKVSYKWDINNPLQI